MKGRFLSLLVALALALSLSIPAFATGEIHEQQPATPYTCSLWAKPELDRAMMPLRLEDFLQKYPDATANMSRLEFASLGVHFFCVQQKSNGIVRNLATAPLTKLNEHGRLEAVFTDTDDFDVTDAYYLGIIQGRGEGIFDPDASISRQEAAVLLLNTYKSYGGVLPEDIPALSFADAEQIAPWARDSVAILSDWGIMNGLPDGTFAPDAPYTREQSILTVLRLYENAPLSQHKNNVPLLFSQKDILSYFEEIETKSREDNYGHIIANRWEGKEGLLIRLDWGGTMHSDSVFYYLHQDGWVRDVDFGVYSTPWGRLSPDIELENPHFSEDGKTFFATITVPRDVLEVANPDNILYPKGTYAVSVNLESMEAEASLQA